MGGRSERMGFPKHELIHRETGSTLWRWHLRKFAHSFSRILLLSGSQSLNLSKVSSACEVHLVPDKRGLEGQGPLVALLTAIETCETEWLYFVAVDYPYLSLEMLSLMGEHKAKGKVIVPEDNSGRAQWLCGLYSVSLMNSLSKVLEQGTRSMRGFCYDAETYKIPWSGKLPSKTLNNINTPKQAREAGFEFPDPINTSGRKS